MKSCKCILKAFGNLKEQVKELVKVYNLPSIPKADSIDVVQLWEKQG